MEPNLGQSGPDQRPNVPQPVNEPQAPPVTPAPIDPYSQQVTAAVPPELIVEDDMVPPGNSAHQPEVVPMLQWQASEYINREKNTTWFVGLAVAAVVLSTVAIFLIKDLTFALLVIVMAIALAVIARRPAKEMSYQLSNTQLRVGDKNFPLHDFRAFGVIQDGAIYYASLVPLKRFRPSVNVYFPQEMGEQIVDILGSVLPMEEMKPDMIDKITEKLNF